MDGSFHIVHSDQFICDNDEIQNVNRFIFVLIGGICVNLTIATIRTIPLTLLTAGVWMVHSGIITLALGSVWYFSTKVEGDVALARRVVSIVTPDGATARVLAIPGTATVAGEGDDQWVFQIASTNPSWELLSGDDVGQRVYAVTVRITPPTGTPFMRQLIAGYPQYTEDIASSGDPAQLAPLLGNDLQPAALSLDAGVPSVGAPGLARGSLGSRRLAERALVPGRGGPRTVLQRRQER